MANPVWLFLVEVVSVAEALPFVSLNSSVIFNEQDLSIQLTERIPNNLGQDQVFFVKGASTPYPQMGEIWLPDHLENYTWIEIGKDGQKFQHLIIENKTDGFFSILTTPFGKLTSALLADIYLP